MKKIIPFLFLAILLTSCGNNEVFKEYRRFDDISWDRYKILNFEVEVEKGQLLDFD